MDLGFGVSFCLGEFERMRKRRTARIGCATHSSAYATLSDAR